MEQKTEASQAVDERHEFEKAMSNIGQAVGYEGDGYYKYSSVRLAWEAWQARAALKAQPAPTEAAQGNTSNDSSSSQRSGNSGELANKQLFENIEQLAQGEDSARLDAARYRWLRNPKRSHSSVGRIIDNTGKATHISEYALDRAIDESRARASAGTGGVK